MFSALYECSLVFASKLTAFVRLIASVHYPVGNIPGYQMESF
jgi:hypothetical protein